MGSATRNTRNARTRWMRAFFIGLIAAAALAGCKRNESGQLPEASGEPIKAQATKVEGFALVGAYPDQHDGDLAIALEFSRPLVSSQDFDALLAKLNCKAAKYTVKKF